MDKTRLARIVAAVMAFLALSAGSAQGAGETITVGPGGGYDFSSIQAAINAAGWHDTVIVYPHTYYENINFLGKAITVKSINPQDPNIVAGTVIDAGGSGSAVTFTYGEGPDAVITGFEGPDAVITGFTITGGGDGTKVGCCLYYGSGIYCYHASPTITRNVVSGNIGLNDDEETINTQGGGICCRSSNAIIARNVIKENEAYWGGGIYVEGDVGTNVTITNNIINGNEAGYGAGISVASADTTIANNLICDNSSLYGGGIDCFEAHIIITNNILWANLPAQIDDWWGAGALSVTYSNVEGDWPGEGNIKEDPLFVDAANGDYHLQLDSPCINAGDPGFVPQPDETDFDGNPRVLSGRVDMGPYEFSGNLRPAANAGPDQIYSSIPSQVTLDGSGSSDPASDPLSYHWTQTFGPEVEIDDANSAITTFSPAEYGGYIFELVVNDGFLDSFADSVNIVVGSGHIPVADAGLPRYPATDPVELDGTGSYDPDNSGPLSYQWQQISGPNLTITGADTPTPTISGFTPTDSIQRCEFQLIVSDGQCESLPGTVFVIIVPYFGSNDLLLINPPFDSDRPTIVAFGGGNCYTGHDQIFEGEWQQNANWITASYGPPYYEYGDMLILYLSSVAPDYKQPIQTMGHSTGGMPAIDVANRLNSTYSDPRYAVNRVTFCDVGCRNYTPSISTFLDNPVDGEQCWIDNYIAWGRYYSGILNITFPGADHTFPKAWVHNSQYDSSWPDNDMYNGGITAGFYYSVAGPGKNLQKPILLQMDR
jgi:hypothetical protein